MGIGRYSCARTPQCRPSLEIALSYTPSYLCYSTEPKSYCKVAVTLEGKAKPWACSSPWLTSTSGTHSVRLSEAGGCRDFAVRFGRAGFSLLVFHFRLHAPLFVFVSLATFPRLCSLVDGARSVSVRPQPPPTHIPSLPSCLPPTRFPGATDGIHIGCKRTRPTTKEANGQGRTPTPLPSHPDRTKWKKEE